MTLILYIAKDAKEKDTNATSDRVTVCTARDNYTKSALLSPLPLQCWDSTMQTKKAVFHQQLEAT